MATLSRGQTFGATETVTNTKLHNLVDLASVTAIVNADCDANMDLADTKIADITTGGKVRGTSILNLPSIASNAGVIPFANISLTSIPNADILPLTLASWVSGISFKDLASIPTNIGQVPYQTLVSSLASGAFPIFDGSSNYVGRDYFVPDTTSIQESSGELRAYAQAGDALQAYGDTERTHGTTSYTKYKEIRVPRAGTYRVKFDLRSDGSPNTNNTVFGRVYLNSSAFGTEQGQTGTGYTTYSEDLVFSAGDLVQLYLKGGSAGQSAIARNFRIYEAHGVDYEVVTD